MIWISTIVGQLFAVAGAIQLMRGIFIGYQALNQVPPGKGFYYMTWGNNWIWIKPQEPPVFLNEEGIRLEHLRRSLTLQGLLLWMIASPFFIANFFLA